MEQVLDRWAGCSEQGEKGVAEAEAVGEDAGGWWGGGGAGRIGGAFFVDVLDQGFEAVFKPIQSCFGVSIPVFDGCQHGCGDVYEEPDGVVVVLLDHDIIAIMIMAKIITSMQPEPRQPSSSAVVGVGINLASFVGRSTFE